LVSDQQRPKNLRENNTMHLYKTSKGILLVEKQQQYLITGIDWDSFINDDQLYKKLQALAADTLPVPDSTDTGTILAPAGSQELWACGVTYLRSKEGRQEEAKAAGGGDFYARVYDAERPEVFFKATAHRIIGQGGYVQIRKDSTWDVPEPELTLLVSSSGKILGYTIGNDMSSRSIEGENPLYLPQAKTYDGCAALGPCVYITEAPLSPDTIIHLQIQRNGQTVFEGSVALRQMKRKLEELVSFVYRACSFPAGCFIMTGTGIVPGADFTLQSGDDISIMIPPIGILHNTVR
jgi:2-dehydro-3-deoxy-D-arabinonate dehydratase